jgi:hypothetical protein
VGWHSTRDDDAYANACRLERKPQIRDRIAYLTRQAEELIAEKRRRIEAQLWAIHEADIGAFWETYEAAKTDQEGKMLTVRKQRAKLINDLPLEFRKLIEGVTVDRNGNVIPKLYSKSEASRELRKMHNIGAQTDHPESDVSRLSDAELIAQLADLAKQLGVDIKLDYSFAVARKASSPADSQVIDIAIESERGTPSAADAADAAAAAELRIAAEPTVAGARPVRKARGSKA